MLRTTYSVVIPWSDKPTKWHPTERTGPFARLVRGCWGTEVEAHTWARENLQGQPYEIKRYRYPEE